LKTVVLTLLSATTHTVWVPHVSWFLPVAVSLVRLILAVIATAAVEAHARRENRWDFFASWNKQHEDKLKAGRRVKINLVMKPNPSRY